MSNVSLKKINVIKSCLIVFFTLIFFIFVYPQLFSFLPGMNYLMKKQFRLGLDLQGGTHLVYEADTREIPASDRAEAIEGVRDVIERRVNAFGIAEPVIQVNKSGDSWRLIVELAGIKDVSEAITLIGQTPFLQFKEENNEPKTDLTESQQKELDTFNQKAKSQAEEYLARVKNNKGEFSVIQKELAGDDGNVVVSEEGEAKINFSNLLIDKPIIYENLGYLNYKGMYGELFNKIGKTTRDTVINNVIETSEGFQVIYIKDLRVTDKEVNARHLLICHKDAPGCTTLLTKEEARTRAEGLRKEATVKNFESLVKANSTEPGAKDSGGSLGWFGPGQMVKTFEDAAMSLEKGTISDVVESEFGFHIILKEDERPLPEVQVERILVKSKKVQDVLPPYEFFKNTELSGKHLKRAVVDFDQTTGLPLVNLEFNDEGTVLLQEISKRNVKKHLAVFLDGKSIIDSDGDGAITNNDIYAPIITEELNDGRAQITGTNDLITAKMLVKRLNSGALPVSINLINQQTVGASLGEKSVNDSLTAGIVGFLLVAVFMLVYYRLPGFTSVLSLFVYSVLLLVFFKLFGITLTLSGIAGFILSIGMAVDANVLIFERIKEELALGKTLYASINDGFKRAWLSIRDGNVSTLLTCVILLTFGTGMIKGFAVTLGIGILVSMFSAIVVTKIFIYAISPVVLGRFSRRLFLGAKK